MRQMNKILILLLTILLANSSFAVAICGIEMPGKYQAAGSNPDLEVEIFKQMPHFNYYLVSPSHHLTIIIGEKDLNPDDVRSISKVTLEGWSQQKLKENLDLFPQRKYNLMESTPFLGQIAGTISTFRYKYGEDKTYYEQRIFIIQSLQCGIDFLAISSENNHKLVQQVVNNFHKTMETQHPKKFWIIPNALWYSDLGQANQLAMIILIVMIVLSVGLIFYVRKRDL